MITLRLPEINAGSTDERLRQMHSFMYQLVQELNWAMATLENGKLTNPQPVAISGNAERKITSEDNFNSIKSLIIKSADIVEAYYKDIVTLINQDGLYAAQSDFGKFVEETNNTLFSDDKGITQQLNSIQQIFDENGNLKAEVLVNGNIYSGILEYAKDGEAIIGLEIGQTTDGFHKFARFTADRLSFYDSNGFESAYVSQRRLYIPHASITLTLTIGGFVNEVLQDKSVVERWVGDNGGTED